MELSLKKYLMIALNLFAFSLFIGLLCVRVCLIDTIDTGVFLALIVPIGCIVLLLPAAYYFAMFFTLRKKCKKFSPVEGIVSNWESSLLHRHRGCIIINVDGEEFSTSAYFSHEECKELVGKTISYAIIDEILFVYKIND